MTQDIKKLLNILHVIASVDPALGGLSAVVRERGVALMKLGHNVEILTFDDQKSHFLHNYPIKVYAIGPGFFNYRLNVRAIPWIIKNSKKYDAIVVEGIWSFHSLATLVAYFFSKFEYYVCIHGMLGPWFKKNFPIKHIKKYFYWIAIEYWLLRNATAVLYGCEEERRLARSSFYIYKAIEAISTYGADRPSNFIYSTSTAFRNKFPSLGQSPYLIFLGRIHPVKGCDQLIEAFFELSQNNNDIKLVIAGPDSNGNIDFLKMLSSRLGINDKIIFTGLISGVLKWEALHGAEAFVLPSHHENFSISTVEALSCGLPVLISKEVNIWEYIDQAGAGLCFDDNVKSLQDALLHWASLGFDARSAMAASAMNLYKNSFTAYRMAKDLEEVFESVNKTR
jgi:glycosyltransferase involved in cell wall biosynthesis